MGEGKAQKRRDPSTEAESEDPSPDSVTRPSGVTSAVIGAPPFSEARTHHGAGWHQTRLQIAPERHHQFAGKRHDGDLADAALDVADPLAEPAAELAVGLMREPQPSELERGGSSAVVAGLADALLAPAAATVVGRVGQPEAAADLTSVVEVAVEYLVGQNLRNQRPDPPELGELNGLRLNRGGRRRAMRRKVL